MRITNIALIGAFSLTATLGYAQCESSKITTTGTISLETKIAWTPVGQCVLQAYQGGRLVGEYGKSQGVQSATIPAYRLTQGKLGRVELKIWAAGSSAPSDAVWVNVEP